MKPRLLDLFCGAGGCSVGYQRAGFDVIGVDINPQPRYPFTFHQGDALEVGPELLATESWDAVHASPPCHAHTSASNRWRGKSVVADSHPDLIPPTRRMLIDSGLPYVIENVVGASRSMLGFVLTLDGGMFGLGVHRPRLFESNVLILSPGRGSHGEQKIGVYGARPDGRKLNYATGQRAARSLEEGRAAMGIDWMEWRELAESIPPAYTEFIGTQLFAAVRLRGGTRGGEASMSRWTDSEAEALRRERRSFRYDHNLAAVEGNAVANYLLRELMVALGKPLVAQGKSPQEVWNDCIDEVRYLHRDSKSGAEGEKP